MNAEQIFYVAVTAILSAAVALTAPWIAYFWYRTRSAEQTAVLKKAMLDRGFSAEQIVEVIEAGADRPTPAAANDDLFRTLTDNCYSAEHVRLILAAVDRAPADQRDRLRKQAAQMAESWYNGAKIAEYIDSRTGPVPPKPEPAAA